jgi:hypothetical protein
MSRVIDEKFEIVDEQIVKRGTGQVVLESEPTFLFRARDSLALPTLEYYFELCIQDGCTEYQLEGMRTMIARFKAYALNNPLKQPGITRGL